MSWKRVKVHDCIEFFNGKGIKTELHTGDNPIYGANGIIGSTKESNYSNGIIIGRVGAYCGAVQVEKGTFWATDNTIVAKAKRDNDNQFWYYQFSDLKLNKYAGGAAQPLVTQSVLKEIDIDLPPLETQKRIAKILSAYDDLIENNLKRIKLLEEAAQNIYKEWFVNFRFPGSEHTEFINGLPNGWERKAYSKVAEFVNGFAFKPSHHFYDGIPIIKIKELKSGIAEDTPRNSGEDIPLKYHFDDGSIIFSWSADIDAYWWSNGKALLNQHLFLVLPSYPNANEYFYFALKNSMQDFRNRTTGATMKHIKRTELDNVLCVVPVEDTVKEFCKVTSPILSLITNLNQQNQKLKEARDILLPRLMNRTIEVGGS